MVPYTNQFLEKAISLKFEEGEKEQVPRGHTWTWNAYLKSDKRAIGGIPLPTDREGQQ